MNEKRRDNKNRILHQGETQLPDGRYRYKYRDALGKERYVYSLRLVSTDPILQGRKVEKSLREKELDIQSDILNGVVSFGGNLTVLQLVDKYASIRKNVRWTTETSYVTVINFLKKTSFGSIRIDKISTSDAKTWLATLQEQGKSYSAICQIRGVLRPAFQMAYEDNLIRKNPFSFGLASTLNNDRSTREAITREQMEKLLSFIMNDRHYKRYYEAIYILFNTGLRISEFTGLTISDIDFDNHRIVVNHQLQRMSNMRYIIVAPKTEAGNRMIPMTVGVEECFKRILSNRKPPNTEPMIDSHSGFLFFNRNGMPLVACDWEHYFQQIIKKYNSLHEEKMPVITPHVCRHTFCSNMANSGMNPKKLQYIMGHSTITITLNTYSHVDFEEAKDEILRIMSI